MKTTLMMIAITLSSSAFANDSHKIESRTSRGLRTFQVINYSKQAQIYNVSMVKSKIFSLTRRGTKKHFSSQNQSSPSIISRSLKSRGTRTRNV